MAQINLTVAYPTLPSSVTDGSGVIAYPTTNDLFSPLTWSATGSLPGGLVLDLVSGAISGTVSAPVASYPVTVTAKDAYSNTASVSVDMTVAYPAATLAYADLGTLTSGSSVHDAPTTSGLAAPLTYTASAGSLPPGLALDTTSGIVSGVPTADVSFPFTVSVTDTYGNSATSNELSGNVTAPVYALSYPSITALQDGVAGSYAPVISGLGSGISYAVSGSVPNGLSIDASGNIVGTPEDYPGSFSFTVTATDGERERELIKGTERSGMMQPHIEYAKGA